MNLPSKNTNLGRVLRAMHNAGPLTARHIRCRAGLAPDTAVTARIRDLRKIGVAVSCTSVNQGNGKALWYYRIDHAPQWVIDGLKAEREQAQGVAA